jgi:nicotinamidase-related amidase
MDNMAPCGLTLDRPSADGVAQMNTVPAPALLLIDLQRGMAAPGLPPRNNPQAEDNAASLLRAWREAGAPVVHVRHMSRTPGSPFWPGAQGAEFQDRFAPEPAEQVFEKNVPDAFVHSGLERWLRVRGIDRLVVVGVATHNSVESTARSAGNLGFDVAVVADATFTFDKVDFSGRLRTAEEVHAMSLANLAGEYARVVFTSEVLRALAAKEEQRQCFRPS